MNNTALAQISKAKIALSQASNIYQVLDIRDKAMAAAAYADAQGAAEAANLAKEVQLRAERKAGKFLQTMEKNPGTKGQFAGRDFSGGSIVQPPEKKETLADFGISKNQSSRWQMAAELPEDDFEEVISTALETGKELTSKAVIDRAREFRKEQERSNQAEAGKNAELPITVTVSTGDFRQILAEFPPNSVDLIFTDPPYDEESIPMYGDLACVAAEILKPGGSLICYVGHYAIGKVYNLMSPYLRFWWTLAVKHNGNSARLAGKWVFVEWKPLLWFVKDFRLHTDFVADLIESHQPGKDEHDWQQDESEAAYYIEHLTRPGDLVIDPFCGSGTTLIAAHKQGRQSIGIEIEEDRANVARHRIQTECGL